MGENHPTWDRWAYNLQKWGMKEATASLLEHAGSISILAAQLMYISQPLLSGAVSSRSLSNIAQVLEDPSQRQAFISYLREAPDRGQGA